jgi:hypothetical protein
MERGGEELRDVERRRERKRVGDEGGRERDSLRANLERA